MALDGMVWWWTWWWRWVNGWTWWFKRSFPTSKIPWFYVNLALVMTMWWYTLENSVTPPFPLPGLKQLLEDDWGHVSWPHWHHTAAQYNKHIGAACDSEPGLRYRTVDWEVIWQPEKQLYLEANCFTRRWVLLALRSQYYKTPWQQICFYLLAPTQTECVSLSSVKFQKCWHFSIESKCWLVDVDMVMVLCFTLLSLALCRACGFGTFVCWDRPVWKQEIPALTRTFLEAVKANT